MSKITKISAPLEEDTPFFLQMGEIYSTTLKYDERLTLTILNPNEAKVRCTVESGAGEVSLYKNGTRLLRREETYSLSTEPGFLTTVRLNTNVTSPGDSERVIEYDRKKLAKQFDVPQKAITKKFLTRNLARQYGVREGSIEEYSTKGGTKKLRIPDSIWELYIVALGSGENKFKVQLLPKKD